MGNVAPTLQASRLRYEASGVALEVDANVGGRVVEFSRGGRNALFSIDEAGGENWGSTFWTSPQSAWNWPPPAEIDREAYRVVDGGSVVSLKSEPSRLLGVSVEKTFSMSSDGVVTIDYAITNERLKACSVAPWEVTRVPRRGSSFFQKGGNVGARAQFPIPSFDEADGIVWVDHGSTVAGDRKLHALGPCTWLAHAANGLLFVKTFDGAPSGREAPDEAAVEIFVSAKPPYVELEQQGTYGRIEPGESLGWRVTWRLVELPESASRAVALSCAFGPRSKRATA